MATSGTFRFGDTFTVSDMLTEALERCGIFGPRQNATHQVSAVRSLNLTLADMANNQLNLWTLEQGAIELIDGQSDYDLPAGTVDVVDVFRRTYERQLGGTATSSSGGTASLAFDGDYATSCTQTQPNGFLRYDFGDGNAPAITMVGIRSNTSADLTLTVAVSLDNAVFTTVLSITKTSFIPSKTVWFVIPSAEAARYIQVSETGGATLALQELYFCTQTRDITMGRISQQDYFSFPDKTTPGTPTSYFVDRQISPVLRIWKPSDGTTTMLFYTRIRQMQDVVTTSNTVDVPYRFLEAVTASLAWRMSIKYAPEREERLMMQAAAAMKAAQEEDDQRTPMRLAPNWR